ncbi:MAG: glycosyltransferase [Halapricum sp.]
MNAVEPALSVESLLEPTTAIVGVIWIIFALYSTSVLFWLFEVVVLARRQLVDPGELTYGYDDVQIRILTVDAEAVVQGTVDSIPDGVTDVHVIAEKEMDIDGATVNVVPDDFECEAQHKGRALEWARQNVPCSREFVLYLDEDTIVQRFHGLPDADVVQITEMPLYTGSWISYLAETFRIGYQYEQRAFGRFAYPLYAWGGGIAIRRTLEDEITWDTETITEDTDFVWRAADQTDLDFRVLNLKFRNQAPPSIRGMFRQRRRWFSGTRQSAGILPRRYRALLTFRVLAWALSPLIPLVGLFLFLFPQYVPQAPLYQIASIAQFLMLFAITLVGVGVFISRERVPVIAVPLTPLLVVLNTAGALWGYVSPVRTFAVTEKVPPKVVERRHPQLSEGDLEAHDGKTPLLTGSGEPLTDS